jgi:hypothetical protein
VDGAACCMDWMTSSVHTRCQTYTEWLSGMGAVVAGAWTLHPARSRRAGKTAYAVRLIKDLLHLSVLMVERLSYFLTVHAKLRLQWVTEYETIIRHCWKQMPFRLCTLNFNKVLTMSHANVLKVGVHCLLFLLLSFPLIVGAELGMVDFGVAGEYCPHHYSRQEQVNQTGGCAV